MARPDSRRDQHVGVARFPHAGAIRGKGGGQPRDDGAIACARRGLSRALTNLRHITANEAGGAEDSLKERSYDATQRTRFRAVLGEVVGRVALAVAERVASSWSWLSGEARPQPSKGEADGDQSRVRSWLQARKGPIDLEPPDFAAAQPINDVEAIEVAVRRWRISVGQQCWASFVGALVPRVVNVFTLDG